VGGKHENVWTEKMWVAKRMFNLNKPIKWEVLKDKCQNI